MTREEKPGLQSERTHLSWDRSALAFLAGGAIPLLHDGGPLAGGRPLLAAAGALLACMVVWFGTVRARRTLQVHPGSGRKVVAPPRLEVLCLGWTTAGFAAIVVIVLMLNPP